MTEWIHRVFGVIVMLNLSDSIRANVDTNLGSIANIANICTVVCNSNGTAETSINSSSNGVSEVISTEIYQMLNSGLFNKKNNNDDYERRLFEQYKLYVELTDRISQRRSIANNFFITANAALLTIASWFKDDFGYNIYLVSAIGTILALFWFFVIRSYSQLNSGKFKLIHEIERQLPLNLFSYEWEILGSGKSYKVYWPLSHVERVVPILFFFLYVALSLLVVFC
jgi:hypothetical protein